MGINDMSRGNAKVSNLTFKSDLTSVAKDGLDDAYAYLKECQTNGVNVCVGLQYRCDIYPNSPYSHKWLYASDITTLDNLYIQIYGFPKNECFKRKAELKATLDRRDVEFGLNKQERAPQPIDLGLER